MISNDCTTHFWSLRVALQDDRAIALIDVSAYEVSSSSYTLDRSNAASINLTYE